MSTPQPIRSRLLRILLLPLISMIAMWGVIAYGSIQEIVTISQTQSRWQAIGVPVAELIGELQQERQLSAEAPEGTGADRPLADQRRATDGKADRVRQVIRSITPQGVTADTPDDIKALVGALDGLAKLRESADSGRLAPRLKVINAYDDLISAASAQFTEGDVLSDVSSYRGSRGLTFYTSSGEYLAREHAVLTSTIVRKKMTPVDRATFVAAMTARRLAVANAERDMDTDLRARYQDLAKSGPYVRLLQVEDRLFGWDTHGAPPVESSTWKSDAEAILGRINRDTQTELAHSLVERQAAKVAEYWRIGLYLGLGLLAVVLSILLSYRFGASLIDELKRLRTSAAQLAEERLPRLVERLRRGDDVDPATEAPALESAGTAEVDDVVHAFSAVQRTAVEAAVSQATLRKGVGQVFLNLSWRNQALLQRQLTLLDTMERRVEEPDILEDLFRLDHLTTRMRRHAENLVILSDATPARRWRDPVSIFDVVRSAVLEVEDYTRVVVPPMPHAPLLVGSAVADVVHLIAELVENATLFSPPDTVVHVRSVTAANGFALEVEDRGLGMSQSTLDELNAKLADPPEFDLVDSDRLGLFVVARLAGRHGIKVVLRRSPYDGTTAIVLLPPSLIATPSSGTPAADGAPQAGRPAVTAPAVRPLGAAPQPGAATVSDLWNLPSDADGNGLGHDGDGAEPPSEWFLAERRPSPPEPPAPPSPRPALSVPSAEDDDLDGLPMRVRQASLAPQLRRTRPEERREVSTRSPEELLSLMSSMQRGWQQGRDQAGQDGAPPGQA
ncbi:sensor histidine kinase [Sphaerisporangium fuscum]|uniref:sensor histidine kinase n=1 Tax=Sphaerisporangium fuscum TaxID=2835868 RepID=UPI001BDC2567|nr:ATP-binding protein [Sphaerisporangium fuscum]